MVKQFISSTYQKHKFGCTLKLFTKCFFSFCLSILFFCPFSTYANSENSNGNKESFTDRIKTIRSGSGEYDVFFDSHHGPYSVPVSMPNSKLGDKSPEAFLTEAHKMGIPIKVTVDSVSETLISIDSELPEIDTSKRTPAKIELPPDLEDVRGLLEKATKPSP